MNRNVLSAGDVIQFITVLLIFVLVLALTYLITRWIAGYQKNMMGKHNIEVIDTFRIAQNKYVQIIRLGNRYLAIAVCKDTITVLREMSEEEIVYTSQEGGTPLSFRDIFEKAKSLKPKK